MGIDGTDNSTEDESTVVRVENRETESILETILRGLALKEEVPVTTLPPLYDHVEPDAIVTLVDHGNRRSADLAITFTIAGNEVTVSDDGRVCIRDE